MISGGGIVEKEEPIVALPNRSGRITYDDRRVTCTTGIVKFNIRAHKSGDRCVISSAVVKEFYETAGEVIVTTRIPRGHCRGSRCASVMEIHISEAVDVDGRGASTAAVKEIRAARGDVDRCMVGAARVEKIRYRKVGVGGDRCIAGATLLVELYRPIAGDGGFTTAACSFEDKRAAGQDLDFGAGSVAAASKNDLSGAQGAGEDFDGISAASVLESDGAGVVVDLATARMAIVESDCTRAFILNGRGCFACGAVIKLYRST